jgi:hypothetical protein
MSGGLLNLQLTWFYFIYEHYFITCLNNETFALTKLSDMKNAKILLTLLIFITAACSKDGQVKEQQTTMAGPQPLSGAQINQQIEQTIEKSGSFNWSDADNFLLWSACMNGDSILTIGFGDTPYTSTKSKSLSSLKVEIIDIPGNGK